MIEKRIKIHFPSFLIHKHFELFQACYAFEHYKERHCPSPYFFCDLSRGCDAKVLRAEEEASLLEEQKRTEVQRLVSNVVLMFLKVPTSPLEEPVKAELLTEENFK